MQMQEYRARLLHVVKASYGALLPLLAASI